MGVTGRLRSVGQHSSGIHMHGLGHARTGRLVGRFPALWMEANRCSKSRLLRAAIPPVVRKNHRELSEQYKSRLSKSGCHREATSYILDVSAFKALTEVFGHNSRLAVCLRAIPGRARWLEVKPVSVGCIRAWRHRSGPSRRTGVLRPRCPPRSEQSVAYR
jgi:hypothetical protein